MRCKLRQIKFQNLKNTPYKSVQFLCYSVSYLGCTSRCFMLKNLVREITSIWGNYTSLASYHHVVCFPVHSVFLFISCSFMFWESYYSWLCLLWCVDHLKYNLYFFLSERQPCCLQVCCFVLFWTNISFTTFSNSSKLEKAKVNIFFLLFNCIYFVLSATLPAALLVFPELMNLFTFHPVLVAEGFVPVYHSGKKCSQLSESYHSTCK